VVWAGSSGPPPPVFVCWDMGTDFARRHALPRRLRRGGIFEGRVLKGTGVANICFRHAIMFIDEIPLRDRRGSREPSRRRAWMHPFSCSSQALASGNHSPLQGRPNLKSTPAMSKRTRRWCAGYRRSEFISEGVRRVRGAICDPKGLKALFRGFTPAERHQNEGRSRRSELSLVFFVCPFLLLHHFVFHLFNCFLVLVTIGDFLTGCHSTAFLWISATAHCHCVAVVW